MTPGQVRQLALSLPQTTEEPHFRAASFRVRGKIFATLQPEGEYLHVFVDDEQRERALAEHPDSCETLLWGKRIAGLRVLLPASQPRALKTLLVQAWSRKAPKSLPRPC